MIRGRIAGGRNKEIILAALAKQCKILKVHNPLAGKSTSTVEVEVRMRTIEPKTCQGD